MRAGVQIDEDTGGQDDKEHRQSVGFDGIVFCLCLWVVDVGEDTFIELGSCYRVVPSEIL